MKAVLFLFALSLTCLVSCQTIQQKVDVDEAHFPGHTLLARWKIFFPENDVQLRDEQFRYLNSAKDLILQNECNFVHVEMHRCSKQDARTKDFEMHLANAIQEYLKSKGVPEDRISVEVFKNSKRHAFEHCSFDGSHFDLNLYRFSIGTCPTVY